MCSTTLTYIQLSSLSCGVTVLLRSGTAAAALLREFSCFMTGGCLLLLLCITAVRVGVCITAVRNILFFGEKNGSHITAYEINYVPPTHSYVMTDIILYLTLFSGSITWTTPTSSVLLLLQEGRANSHQTMLFHIFHLELALGPPGQCYHEVCSTNTAT